MLDSKYMQLLSSPCKGCEDRYIVYRESIQFSSIIIFIKSSELQIYLSLSTIHPIYTDLTFLRMTPHRDWLIATSDNLKMKGLDWQLWWHEND